MQEKLLTKQQQVNEIIRCGKDPAYFIRKYAKIQHPLKGTIPFDLYDFQEDCLNDFQNNRFNIVLKSRQLGLSTISAAYATWLAIFYKDKNVLVIATKLATAQNFIKKVHVMLQSLPTWLLMPKFEPSKQQISFSNGSQVKAVPTSEDAGRSESLSLLIVDECVTGDALIEIKDKFTGEEKKVSMSEFHSMLDHENRDTSYIYLSDDDDLG